MNNLISTREELDRQLVDAEEEALNDKLCKARGENYCSILGKLDDALGLAGQLEPNGGPWHDRINYRKAHMLMRLAGSTECAEEKVRRYGEAFELFSSIRSATLRPLAKIYSLPAAQGAQITVDTKECLDALNKVICSNEKSLETARQLNDNLFNLFEFCAYQAGTWSTEYEGVRAQRPPASSWHIISTVDKAFGNVTMPKYFALEEITHLEDSADLAIIVERKQRNPEWQARRIKDGLEGDTVPAKAWKYLLGLVARDKRAFYEFVGDRPDNHSKYAPDLKKWTDQNGIRDLFGRLEDSTSYWHGNDRQNPNKLRPDVKVLVACDRSLYSILTKEI